MPVSSVRHGSDPVTVPTPRGPVEVVRQQWRSKRAGSRWEWEWRARRCGKREWRPGSTAREAIRQATLVPAGKPPKWLVDAAAQAAKELASMGDPE
jgi:hypothetical protein